MTSARPVLSTLRLSHSIMSPSEHRDPKGRISAENMPSRAVLVACGALVPVALGTSAALNSALFGALALGAGAVGGCNMLREGHRLARAGQAYEATTAVAQKGIELGCQVGGALLISGMCAASAAAILATAPLTWMPCAAAGFQASSKMKALADDRA